MSQIFTFILYSYLFTLKFCRYNTFAHLQAQSRLSGRSHPCIIALEDVLDVRILLAEATPHPRTLLTDLAFYAYNESSGEFLEQGT